MKICLGIGDRTGEEFIKSALTKMVDCVSQKGIDDIDAQIREIYSNEEYDNETKKAKRAEVLLKFFDGHALLSRMSLATISLVKDSGITSIEFEDDAPYRECVVDRCSNGCDVLILSEMLEGQTNFQALCQEIKVKCPKVRIIVLGGAHEKGDAFLQGLTQKAIYDITYGDKVNFLDLFKLIFKANTYADSLKYLNSTQTSSQEKESVVKKPLKVEPIEDIPPVQEKKSFLSNVVKKEAAVVQPVKEPVSHDTDLFMDDTPVVSTGGGTELLADDEPVRDGLVCYPYDLKPLLITDRKTKESVIVNPDGTRETGGNLPAVIKSPKDIAYEGYISSLLTDGSDNRGVMSDTVHPSQQMNYGVKAKSMLFTSTIQGVGCSTLAFNFAVLCAEEQKKRVLFVDANLGDSSSLARLEIPQTIGVSLDDLMRDPSRISEILNKQILMTQTPKNHAARMAYLPDTLSYITWGKDIATNLAWVVENADKFNDVLTKLSFSYDYIVIDSSLILSNAVNDTLLQFVNTIIPVVTQDIYSTNMTANQIHNFDKYNIASKVKVICNRYEACPPLTTDSFSGDFYNASVFPIHDDNKGFIKASSIGLPYVLTKSVNRKIIKAMRMFLTDI